jgi:hypothetical protein
MFKLKDYFPIGGIQIFRDKNKIFVYENMTFELLDGHYSKNLKVKLPSLNDLIYIRTK